jgi:predicted ArsR family transcriptional regulator
MAPEKITPGVQRAYAVLFTYIIAIVEEVGTEKAFSVLSKVVEERGKADGKALIKRLGINRGDLEAGLAVYSAFLSDSGIVHEVLEKRKDRVLIKVDNCPIYNAYFSLGVACDWLVEVMCKEMTLPLITNILKQVHPRLRPSIKRFRSSREGYCLEELIIQTQD